MGVVQAMDDDAAGAVHHAQTVAPSPKPSNVSLIARSKKLRKRVTASAQPASSRGGVNTTAGDPVVPADSELVRVVRVERKTAGAGGEPPERSVLLSRTAKAPQLVISEDRLTVSGNKGYRSVRATHGACEGAWYCEVHINHLGPAGHVRLGWSTRKAELHAPAGFDKFGYCYRDIEGSCVHNGHREPYGAVFAEGDVVGMYLYLPPGGRALEVNSRKMVRFKGALYYTEEPEPEPEVLPGSIIAYAVNGMSQGVAFSNILEGTYYPTASLFTETKQVEAASVTFNFGPNFAFPPPTFENYPAPRPAYELVGMAATAVSMDDTALEGPVAKENVPREVKQEVLPP